MGAARYLLGAWGPRRWVALIGVALLTTASLGVAVLAGLGASRAATGWDDLHDRSHGEDVVVDATTIDAARTLAVQATKVDGVATAAAMAYSYLVPEGRRDDFFGGVILSLAPGVFDTVWRPVLRAGRLPAADRADEVVVNEEFLVVTGLDVGGTFVLVDPVGLINQPMTITGVGVLPSDFTFASGAPLAFPSVTFTEQWESQLQELSSTIGAEVLAPGVLATAVAGVTPDDLTSRLTDALPKEDVKALNSATNTGALVVETIRLQRDGYFVLALVSAVAALAMFALLFAGATRFAETESTTLRALGLSRRGLALAVLLPGLLVVVIGTVGAMAAAVAFESRVPTGLAARVAAGHQIGDDTSYLVFAGLVIAILLSAAVLAVAWRATKVSRSGTGPARRTGQLLRWPALAVGVRYALGGLTRTGRRQVVAAVLTVAIAAAGVSAVAVIVQSRDTLLANPARTGAFYDVYLSTYTDADVAAADQQTLAASPAVAGIATIEVFTAAIDGQSTSAITVTAPGERLEPVLVAGRRPVDADELLASVPFLRRLGRHVGDTVDVGGPSGVTPFHVVGTAVMPFVASDAAGEQVALTAAGRERIGAETDGQVIGVDLRDPDAARTFRTTNDKLEACDSKGVLQLLGVDELAGPASGEVNACVPRKDQRAAALDELGSLPTLIVGFLALVGVIGLAFLLSTSLRSTRRDLAVLRSLGFTRRQSGTTVLVHAGVIGLIGAVVALPFGLASGRWAWRGVTEALGVSDHPEISIIGTLGVVVGAFLIAELLAAPVARRVVSRAPATDLRAD